MWPPYKVFPFQYLPLIEITIYACHRARFCFSLGIIKRIAQVRWINTEKTFRQILSWNWNFQWNYPKMNSVNIRSNKLRIRDWRTSNLSHSRKFRLEMMKLNLDTWPNRRMTSPNWFMSLPVVLNQPSLLFLTDPDPHLVLTQTLVFNGHEVHDHSPKCNSP